MSNHCYLAVTLLHVGAEGQNAAQRWQKYSCQSSFNSEMGKKVIPENHIKRPMNAFMAWSKRERRKMVEEGTNLNNSVMSRILGERWKQLSEEEKKTWKRTAEKLKKEHAKVKLLIHSWYLVSQITNIGMRFWVPLVGCGDWSDSDMTQEQLWCQRDQCLDIRKEKKIVPLSWSNSLDIWLTFNFLMCVVAEALFIRKRWTGVY